MYIVSYELDVKLVTPKVELANIHIATECVSAVVCLSLPSGHPQETRLKAAR